MAEICKEVARKMDFQVIEINGEGDHVHLLIEYPPKLSVSQIVNALKGVSSRMLRKEFKLTPHVDHLWSPSYFALSCGGECSPEGGSLSVGNYRTRKGAPIEEIKKYIENQEKPP